MKNEIIEVGTCAEGEHTFQGRHEPTDHRHHLAPPHPSAAAADRGAKVKALQKAAAEHRALKRSGRNPLLAATAVAASRKETLSRTARAVGIGKR